jgi:hypothetical protein
MVATQICIGTVDMYDSGIGGGGFVLVRSKAGVYEFIDFRETAPAAAYEKMFTEETIKLSLRGGLGEAYSHSEIIIYVTVRDPKSIFFFIGNSGDSSVFCFLQWEYPGVRIFGNIPTFPLLICCSGGCPK